MKRAHWATGASGTDKPSVRGGGSEVEFDCPICSLHGSTHRRCVCVNLNRPHRIFDKKKKIVQYKAKNRTNTIDHAVWDGEGARMATHNWYTCPVCSGKCVVCGKHEQVEPFWDRCRKCGAASRQERESVHNIKMAPEKTQPQESTCIEEPENPA